MDEPNSKTFTELGLIVVPTIIIVNNVFQILSSIDNEYFIKLD